MHQRSFRVEFLYCWKWEEHLFETLKKLLSVAEYFCFTLISKAFSLNERNIVSSTEKKFPIPLFVSDTGKFLCIYTRLDERKNNMQVYLLAVCNYTPRIVIENVLSQLTICKTSHRRILETMTTWWIQILSAISADRQFCSIPFHYLNNEEKYVV